MTATQPLHSGRYSAGRFVPRRDLHKPVRPSQGVPDQATFVPARVLVRQPRGCRAKKAVRLSHSDVLCITATRTMGEQMSVASCLGWVWPRWTDLDLAAKAWLFASALVVWRFLAVSTLRNAVLKMVL